MEECEALGNPWFSLPIYDLWVFSQALKSCLVGETQTLFLHAFIGEPIFQWLSYFCFSVLWEKFSKNESDLEKERESAAKLEKTKKKRSSGQI